MKTWTIKVETTTGDRRTLKFRAATLSEAVDLACEEQTFANILGV